MIFAVPTYRHVDRIGDETLAFLDRSGVDRGDVLILAPDDEDATALADAYADWRDSIHVTAPGLSRSRAIAERDLIPDAVEVVWINDDVRGLRRRLNEKESETADLLDVVGEGFDLMRRAGATLWGVYSVANPYFMKPKVRLDLRHIVGSFYGKVNDRDRPLATEFGDAKEDYERTLRHYEADGVVVRLDYIGVETTYYNRRRGDPIGGRFAERTPETVEENVRRLIERWPGWVRRNTRRKSPFPEILLG